MNVKSYPPCCDFSDCFDCQSEVRRIDIEMQRAMWKETKLYACHMSVKHKAHEHPDHSNVKCPGKSYDNT